MQISRLSVLSFLGSLFTISVACQRSLIEQETGLTLTNSQTTAIIGGTTASANEFPFLVNIWINTPKDDYVAHLCGGSLIHKNWVLTAAHCVLEDVTDKSAGTIKPKDLNLYIGSNKMSGQGGTLLQAQAIFVHPDFSWPYHDVALIKLTESVTDVMPIFLNDKDLENEKGALPSAVVAGWGLTDAQGKLDPEELQKVSLQLIPRKTCGDDNFPRKKNWTIGDDIICALSNQNTTASCPGDSGGPFFVLKDGRFVQIGIVSWGAACRGNSPDFLSNVGGYANVANALPWIQSLVH